MKIIILGAGRVGQSVADSLVSERNDITVIDTDAERLRDLESRFDLRGVVGNGIEPAVLAEAGAQDTDLLIACAAQDETNLVCCKVAQLMFNIPKRIARVRSTGFQRDERLVGPEGFAVDRIICPEESLTHYIGKLIDYPEAMQVREFAGGRACLVSVRARAGAPMVGHTVAEMRNSTPDVAVRLVAIYRRFPEEPDRFVACAGETRIEPGDEVFVLAAREHIAHVLATLHRRDATPVRPVRRIMIAGGGRVGLHLALELGKEPGRFLVKIIEDDSARCIELASRLPSDVLVLQGDTTDENLLGDESIDEIDLFLALTDDDEDNIMSCLLAKRLGARRVLALINRRSYADLMHGTQIDIALSPAQAMLGELLAYVRQGDVQAVHSLRRGVAEALEIVVRGDRKTSRVVGRKVSDLALPRDVHIGLIVRGLPDSPDVSADELREPQVIIPRSATALESGDHVVFFLPHKRLVRDVEKLFRVSPTFF
ncbi:MULTISPECIES: Trk system potassium transporter TrkA [unclassified Acidovorax]|jgi:trk system potassium uptake protein TrkA|uniref:Trk system potassium transporter TrkA n=1 Tax=unclassified Acidovorax TaxID=2684926 RepID=UPI000BCEB3E2|nr:MULTISPECIES: Trk system potassium transporter TrkA [unclassified Acidovorax]MCL5740753.1 Trk system potassium transporter TrkA [Betaproteobacteria bacterium]OZA56588.1 MAG: Trk system potassium transport protein TrkA [Acidovorax sp. 17-64-282]HQS20700.1 Trk system potassium transporter TrkA [Acidovorax defluvii]OYY30165.1 MAG: Trk system potassium transport protein TrkA [Acidovorax sp. 35-64-16]OYY85295.1 MAG: Trk system potassium transport protein TrkA [Acidovorax sp. 28-64-14]